MFQKALAVSPKDRFPRTAEFWSAFGAALGGDRSSTVAAPPSLSYQPQRGTPTAPTELAPPELRVASTTGGSTAATGPGPSATKSKAGLIAVAGVAVAGAIAAAFFLKGSDGAGQVDGGALAKPIPTAASAAPPVASAAPVELKCPERMAKIPAGQFFQGSDAKDALANEKPAHNVTLDAYCIDLREVTAGEYEACSSIGKCKRPGNEVELAEDHGCRQEALLAALHLRAKRQGRPSDQLRELGDGTHLLQGSGQAPADRSRMGVRDARSGRSCLSVGRRRANGEASERVRHRMRSLGQEARRAVRGAVPGRRRLPDDGAVGKFEAGRSRFGPYDVVGNVWEWVSDWYADYTPEEKKNPIGPDGGERKVIRGGAWNGSYTSWLRPSFRYAQDPNALSYGIGFRCAKTLAP